MLLLVVKKPGIRGERCPVEQGVGKGARGSVVLGGGVRVGSGVVLWGVGVVCRVGLGPSLCFAPIMSGKRKENQSTDESAKRLRVAVGPGSRARPSATAANPSTEGHPEAGTMVRTRRAAAKSASQPVSSVGSDGRLYGLRSGVSAGGEVVFTLSTRDSIRVSAPGSRVNGENGAEENEAQASELEVCLEPRQPRSTLITHGIVFFTRRYRSWSCSRGREQAGRPQLRRGTRASER